MSQLSTSPNSRTGMVAIFGAYLMWGAFPLYFVLTTPTSALEVVAWRVVFSCVFCGVLIVLAGSTRTLIQLLASKCLMGLLALAGLLIGANWLLYVLAVTSGNTVEASLGYFINPLVSVLLGVLVLGERLRRLQWCAVGIAALAVLTMGVLYGTVPWLALGLAFSFGFYGLVKSRLGKGVSALHSLVAETLVLLPPAVAVIGWLAFSGTLSFGQHGAAHTTVLALSGIVTALPLLCFAVAAANLPLSLIGIVQYATPLIQFLIALFILGEHMSSARWVGFILVWCAVLLFVVDALLQLQRRGSAGKKSRRAARP